jgi:hypothetical protein
MKRSKHPSLPWLLLTGSMLIGLELHWSWELSTPRERSALVVASVGEANSLMAVVARVGAVCGL